MKIVELEAHLHQMREFKTYLEADTLKADNHYLSFGIVIEAGYDRTGPSFVTVEE